MKQDVEHVADDAVVDDAFNVLGRQGKLDDMVSVNAEAQDALNIIPEFDWVARNRERDSDDQRADAPTWRSRQKATAPLRAASQVSCIAL